MPGSCRWWGEWQVNTLGVNLHSQAVLPSRGDACSELERFESRGFLRIEMGDNGEVTRPEDGKRGADQMWG